MGKTEKRTCLNCGEPFTADARNARHQRYCTAVACKAASKRASQANWLAKPENRDYHRGTGIGGPGQGVAGSPSRIQPTNAVAAGAGTRRLDHGGRCRNHPTASVRTDAARTAGADIL
jgi:hypothetical protein